ncbi:MAG: sigma-70 family RNA polymerase sigma factor [Planctomycetota bacterium]
MGTKPSHRQVDQLTTHRVRQAVEGDQASLEWIVTRFSPFLMAAARRHMGWRPRPHVLEAEELVQETWLIAMPRLAGVRPRDERFTPVLLSFLVGILWRQHQSALRKALRAASAGEALESVADSTRGAISRMIHSEDTQKLHEALEELQEDARNIIVMRGLEQISTKDVASLLGISAEAVSSRYRRAMKALRQRITDPMLQDLLDHSQPT